MDTPSQPIKIALVDDHQVFREGLKALFLGEIQFKIVQEADSGEELLDQLRHGTPDVSLIDIDLPKMNGFELAKEMTKHFPSVKKIMLSSYQSKYSISEALKSGANGYLHKDTSKEEIIRAIETVIAGKPYFGQSISGTVYEEYAAKMAEQGTLAHDSKYLTDREVEIIRHISKGLTYKEIANKLNISVRTVESHKNNIQDKLNIHTVPELVKFAIKNNYID